MNRRNKGRPLGFNDPDEREPNIETIADEVLPALPAGNNQKTLMGVAALEALPISHQLRIARYYMARMSYKKMAAKLKEEGIETNDAALHRYCMRYLHSFSTDNRVIDKRRLEELQEEASLKILEASVKILEKLDAFDEAFRVKNFADFTRVAASVGKIITARASMERAKAEVQKAVDAWGERYRQAVRRELSEDPELVERIYQVLNKVSDKLIESELLCDDGSPPA